MKKIVNILIAAAMLFFLVSCAAAGISETTQEKQPTDPAAVSAGSETASAAEAAEETVSVAVPASYFDDEESKKSIIENAEKNGFISAKENENGSVTFLMTKDKQRVLLNDLKKTMDETFSDWIKEDTSSFTKITYNDDCTEYTVLTDKDKYSLFDAMYAIPIYMVGYNYQSFEGKKADDIDVVVKFCNKDNVSEVLYSGSYKNYIKEDTVDSATEAKCNHSFTDTVVKPTYYEKGYTTHLCQKCGYSYVDSEVDKLTYPLSNSVIYDANNVKVTLKNIEVDRWGDINLIIEFENNTTKKLTFSVDDGSVNDYMVSASGYAAVEAGKKKNDEISFSESQLTECGISEIHKIEFTLRVYESDNWLADDIARTYLTIYPLLESASEIKTEERVPVAGECVIADNKDIRFIIEKVYTDSNRDFILKCYLENKTDKELSFSFDDSSVNDYMINPYWSKSVMGGKRAYASISFDSDDLAKNGINDVEKIEFKLKVRDANDWLADSIYSAVHGITIK